jgi:hypothetical protein
MAQHTEIPAEAPPCPRCGAALRVTWQAFRDGTRHLRGRCGRCQHTTFLPQSDALAAALAYAASAGELQGELFGGEVA